MAKQILCAGWEEYKYNHFVRYEEETKLYVAMVIGHSGRTYSQGKTKSEAKIALESAKAYFTRRI